MYTLGYPHAHSHFPYAIPVPTMGRMYNLCITYAQHADPVGNYVQNLWITLGTGGRWGYRRIVTVPASIQNSRKLGLTPVSSCVL